MDVIYKIAIIGSQTIIRDTKIIIETNRIITLKRVNVCEPLVKIKIDINIQITYHTPMYACGYISQSPDHIA